MRGTTTIFQSPYLDELVLQLSYWWQFVILINGKHFFHTASLFMQSPEEKKNITFNAKFSTGFHHGSWIMDWCARCVKNNQFRFCAFLFTLSLIYYYYYLAIDVAIDRQLCLCLLVLPSKIKRPIRDFRAAQTNRIAICSVPIRDLMHIFANTIRHNPHKYIYHG